MVDSRLTNKNHPLSDKMVRGLENPETGNRITYDGGPKAIRGFGIRVTAAGAKSFVLNYTVAGRERRLTIGGYSAWTVAAARMEAKRLRQETDRGVDPLGERQAERLAPTIRDLAKRAIEEHFSKRRSATRYEIYGDRVDDKGDPAGGQIVKWIIPILGQLKVADIKPSHVEELYAKVTKAAPVRANRVMATLSKMMALAIRWGMRTDNPVKNAVERNAETKRKVYLKPEQIARLSDALAAYSDQNTADAVRLLLLTGARRMEVLAARWDQFDLAAGQWVKPASTTKQRQEHEVPLSAPALELLVRRRASVQGEYVFPGRGTPHLTEIKKGWASLAKTAGLEGVRLHDLRHTAASILVSGGATLPMIGALLGHSQIATTNRYAHLYTDPLREAADRLGAVVTGNGKSAEIMLIKRGKAQ